MLIKRCNIHLAPTFQGATEGCMARKPRSKGAGSSGIPPIVMPHIDTLWFKRRLADRKISGRQAAAKLGMGPAGFSYMLRGRRMLQMDEAAAFAQLLGVSFDEVVIRAGIQRDLVRADRMTTVRNPAGGRQERLRSPVQSPWADARLGLVLPAAGN
jgi:transcriptional regulator with XRE-family HTH domain